MKESSKSKNRKIFLNALVPLLLITIISCFVFSHVSLKIINNYVKSETSRIAEKLVSNIMERLDPAIINAENFADSALISQDSDFLENTIHAFGKNIPYSRAIYYGTGKSRRKGGVLYDSSGWIPDIDWDPATRGWYKDALAKSGQIAFSSAYVDADTGRLCVTISHDIKNKAGKVTGVVGVDLMLDELTGMVADTTPPSPSGKIYILSQEGLYLTNPDAEKITVANYFEESAIPMKPEEYLSGNQISLVDGKRYYAVGKIGSSPWYVVMEGPLSEFTGGVKRTIFLFELVLILFCVLSSLYNFRNTMLLRKDEIETGAKIYSETQSLVVAAKENAATSQDQSAAVKEIVATMEDNNALTENIATKVKDVSKVAGKTSGDVNEGVKYLEENVRQLHEIASANQNTIDGIKHLGEKIDNIWDIVTLINSVADQAKIIAFNAELEASSAGDAGKNFHIVASEIRRLADGIIDGTKEIKDRINEIQQSSDSLILASESGTEKINEGCENAKSLEQRFESIKNASEITATSAGDITTIIQQQTMASEQILITLKQIAAGVENFTSATENISQASENLKKISEALNN